MGQTNNCLQYRSNSYSVEEEMLVTKGQEPGLQRSKNRQWRLRSVFSTSAPPIEEGVVVLSRYAARRTSDSAVGLEGSPRSRRFSLENSLAKCEISQTRRRRASLLGTFSEAKSGPSRRGTFPFPSKHYSRTLWSLRSLSLRKEKANDRATPHRRTRNRSASLGQTIVAMAHHKLRASTGASPTLSRAADCSSGGEDSSQQQQQAQEYENVHHQPACVESLVRRCAACFGQERGECLDDELPKLLFLTHAWFMTSEQLLVLFSQLYEDEDTPVGLKRQVFFSIRYWMKEFPQVFDLDAALVEAVKDLQARAAGDDSIDDSWIDLSNRGNYRWMRADRLSVRPVQGAGRKRRKVSLVFHHLEPEELAIHISYLEYKCFRRLTFDDFHQYAVRATIKDIAKLQRCVFLFNNITFWVQVMVLGQHTPQERAAVITKYIKIAQKLREMRNYNTLMAVVGGLTYTAIARLKKTMSALPKDSVKALEELVELVDSRSNYVAYRRDYAQQEGGFKIPVIGVHLKDIISLHTAMPDRIGDGLINVKKMMAIGATFQDLLNLQQISFPHEVNKDLVNTLRVSLYLYYTEEEIYALSLRREPRDTKNSVSSMNSPAKGNGIAFAEYTKFTCQLDNDTVKQHVTAMVESVFKAYDHDSDGFISEEEFDGFRDNFPMMESFSAMDVDRDGKISRSEMCEYFMKASAFRRNDFCQNFTHEFVETTYFHPAFCQECEKLLWGLVKQGWKCKGCGINCHKHCKDRIVQECRPKQQQQQQQSSSASAKTNGARPKSSVSSESDLSANGDVLTAIISNAAQNQALEDEAFDGPRELNPPASHRMSPSTMHRSTSLASADVSPRNLLRHLQESKTPPPPRKTFSQDGGGGRKSLQKKVHNMIARRNNSHKVRATTEVSTQTPPRSPAPHTPLFPANRSFLYPDTPDTPRAGRQTNGRLGSCGEDLEDVHVSQMNNNHVITHVTRDVASDMKDLRLIGRDAGVRPDTSSSAPCRNSYGQNNSVGRRDSGLSGCSALTSSENSVPATPVLLFDYPAAGNSLLVKQNSIAFKYPPSFTYEDIPQNSDCESASSLVEENARLREANCRLHKQLRETQEYVKRLEGRVGKGERPPRKEGSGE